MSVSIGDIRELALRTRYLNSGGKPDGFVQGCIDAHNTYRQKHGAPPLAWNKELQVRAQAWADQMAATGALDHDMNGIKQFKDGENIGFSVKASYRPLCQGSSTANCYHCSETVNSWYNEGKNYDYQQGKSLNGKTYLHFTQVSVLFHTNKFMGEASYIDYYTPYKSVTLYVLLNAANSILHNYITSFSTSITQHFSPLL